MDQSSLGAPLRVFPYDPDQRKTTLFIGLGLIGIAFAFPVLYALDPVAVGVVPLYFSPVVGLIGLGALAHFVYTKNISLTLYQGGFVYRDKVVPYARIRAIRYELIHVIGGASSYNRGNFEVRLDDGSKVSPTLQLETMEKVIGGVVEQAMPVLVEGLLGAIRAGNVVRSGPFEFHPQGIVCNGKSIEWARAALSSSGSNTHVQLLDVDPDEGDYTKVHEAKRSKLDNADALEVVAERLRVEAIRARG